MRSKWMLWESGKTSFQFVHVCSLAPSWPLVRNNQWKDQWNQENSSNFNLKFFFPSLSPKRNELPIIRSISRETLCSPTVLTSLCLGIINLSMLLCQIVGGSVRWSICQKHCFFGDFWGFFFTAPAQTHATTSSKYLALFPQNGKPNSWNWVASSIQW